MLCIYIYMLCIYICCVYKYICIYIYIMCVYILYMMYLCIIYYCIYYGISHRILCSSQPSIITIAYFKLGSCGMEDTPILTSLWQATSSKDNDAIDRPAKLRAMVA